MQDVEKQILDDLKAQTPKEALPGTVEFIRDGQVNTLDNAVGVLASNNSPIVLDDLTRPGWADGLTEIHNEFTALRDTLETKSADVLAQMFPELAAAGGEIRKTLKDNLVMKRVLESLSTSGRAQEIQSTMLNQWWAQYTMTVLKEAQDRGVPGFENLVGEDLTPSPELFDPATGQIGPQSILRVLQERSLKLQEQGALPMGKSLVDMFVAEYTNRDRLQRFYANVISPRSASESAIALAVFGHRERQAFYKRIADIYNSIPRVEQVVQTSEQQKQQQQDATRLLPTDNPFAAILGS